MLMEFLEKAIEIGADEIQIEYKDQKEWIFAFKGSIGVGIGSLNPDAAKPLFKEMDGLKKTKRAIIGGITYKLVFSRYESFGEWVQRIRLQEMNRDARSQRA